MKKIIKLLCVCSALLFLASCSSKSGGVKKEVQPPIQPLACIVAMPAVTSVDKDDTVNYEKAKTLEKGASYISSVMARELKENPKVRVLNSVQAASLVSEISGGISGTVAALGQKLNCDGVLTTTISKFKQRQGGEYGAEDPASAKFKMVLRHAETGTILWSADYSETQESFLSNILSYNKMQSRGFKWVTVEQLVEQGVKERLQECPYL